MAKGHTFILPPLPKGTGRAPSEYAFMLRTAELIKLLKGREEELITAIEFGALLNVFPQWLRAAAREGRGPKPTYCGMQIAVFGRDLIDWLKFLEGERAKLARRPNLTVGQRTRATA